MTDTSTSVVTTYYLEMREPPQLRSKINPAQDFRIEKVGIQQPAFNSFLYALVGKPWQWTDKLVWSERQWQQYLEECNVHTWVAYKNGAIAGYYELHVQAEGDVEIGYFGLVDTFTGAGLGGYFLSHAIESAWSLGAHRVWVHTCTLDHPGALANYKARGMKVYKEETE
ncbi:GCN5 family acetyltransferase [Pokkaliibacter plantistimulans]|uniref:GCN5 family acetyltransferase n=1 Tax=Pokkaliibacter plantistimulans TaxID=1635171 RepID=A0ABX5M093_9GAMM|nr:GNAT family N-acetyltransferase [Pokkaliibacter plantistimulans]PXF30853.1 GCN5 family acetyltransferase [Pokkaliibacter plantistimulans]